jgi:hypothetical protein
MTDRAEVERQIVDEEAALEQLARLLENKHALAQWPAHLRAALALALDDPSMSRAETWKATALQRHLFGPEATLPGALRTPPAPSAADRKRAEHARSGLAAFVRYRIGEYLSSAMG